MSDRKRVRTGCLTCRKRRIKCDERRPSCERCHATNIHCEGYEVKRHIKPSIPTLKAIQNRGSAVRSPELPPGFPRFRPDGLPLVGCPNNPTLSQVPHQRARDVLAHQQFTFRTAPLLFREDHLYFWRDRILEAAWDAEYVFSAVAALGTCHRALLLLSQPNEKWRGLDTKVIAMQMYGKALRQVSEQFDKNDRSMDLLIAVLLLLTYFECIVGNPAAAFRHLRAAERYFTTSESDLRLLNVSEPLKSCIQQLKLVEQSILPLPKLEFFEMVAEPVPPSQSATYRRVELLNVIAAHGEVNRTIWAPLNWTYDQIDCTKLTAFQTELLRWREMSNEIFQDRDNERLSSWTFVDELPIPPQALHFPSVDAALSVALYNCYMAKTLWLLSIATNTNHPYELSAYLYIYQNLRIVEGILDNTTGGVPYLPCEALTLGVSPILYLSAQCCYNVKWQSWAIEKLRSIGQEGLFNSEAFATCLDLLQSCQKLNEDVVPEEIEGTMTSRSPLGPPPSRVVPSLIPDLDGHVFVAFYVRMEAGCKKNRTRNRSPTQVIRRASWRSEYTDDAEGRSVVDLCNPNSQGSSDLFSEIGIHMPLNESTINEWEIFLQNPAFHLDNIINIQRSS